MTETADKSAEIIALIADAVAVRPGELEPAAPVPLHIGAAAALLGADAAGGGVSIVRAIRAMASLSSRAELAKALLDDPATGRALLIGMAGVFRGTPGP